LIFACKNFVNVVQHEKIKIDNEPEMSFEEAQQRIEAGFKKMPANSLMYLKPK
jgi:hypothetical protein